MKLFRPNRSSLRLGLLIAIASIIPASAVHAGETMLDGQPCNEACRSWMGIKENRDSTGSIESIGKTSEVHSVRKAPDVTSKRRLHTMSELVKSSSPHVPKLTLTREPLPLITTQRVARDVWQARPKVPLPPLRPEHLDGPDIQLVNLPQQSEPSPALKPNPPRTAESLTLGKTASVLSQPAASAAPSDTAALPHSKNATIAISPKRTGEDISPMEAAVAHPSRMTEKPTEQQDMPTRPAAGSVVDRSTSTPLPSRPLVASLPNFAPNSASVEESSSGSDVRTDRGASASESEAPALPSVSAGGRLSVKVGQVATDPRGTDVHVVVINNLQRPAKNVKVVCDAKNLQGLDIGESVTNVSGIERSDVAFGQVSFPSQIQLANSDIVCVAKESPAALDHSRP